MSRHCNTLPVTNFSNRLLRPLTKYWILDAFVSDKESWSISELEKESNQARDRYNQFVNKLIWIMHRAESRLWFRVTSHAETSNPSTPVCDALGDIGIYQGHTSGRGRDRLLNSWILLFILTRTETDLVLCLSPLEPKRILFRPYKHSLLKSYLFEQLNNGIYFLVFGHELYWS